MFSLNTLEGLAAWLIFCVAGGSAGLLFFGGVDASTVRAIRWMVGVSALLCLGTIPAQLGLSRAALGPSSMWTSPLLALTGVAGLINLGRAAANLNGYVEGRTQFNARLSAALGLLWVFLGGFALLRGALALHDGPWVARLAGVSLGVGVGIATAFSSGLAVWLGGGSRVAGRMVWMNTLPAGAVMGICVTLQAGGLLGLGDTRWLASAAMQPGWIGSGWAMGWWAVCGPGCAVMLMMGGLLLGRGGTASRERLGAGLCVFAAVVGLAGQGLFAWVLLDVLYRGGAGTAAGV